MRAFGSLIAALIAAVSALAAPSLAQTPSPGPALWRIADDDSEVWLFGSVHALRPDVQWRRPELADALAAADAVYFEAPTDIFSQVSAAATMIRLGTNPPGEKLTDYLSDEGDRLLADAAAELGVPIDNFEGMRPWFAFMSISAQSISASAAEFDEGVDVQLTLDALKAKKELRHFETMTQQAKFLADLTLDAQVEILEGSLQQLDAAPQQLEEIFAAWSTGDVEALEGVVFEGVDELPAEFYEVFFVRRNTAWVEQLDALMQGSGAALVVVGAGHLLGPDSVIALMEARGYAAERM